MCDETVNQCSRLNVREDHKPLSRSKCVGRPQTTFSTGHVCGKTESSCLRPVNARKVCKTLSQSEDHKQFKPEIGCSTSPEHFKQTAAISTCLSGDSGHWTKKYYSNDSFGRLKLEETFQQLGWAIKVEQTLFQPLGWAIEG